MASHHSPLDSIPGPRGPRMWWLLLQFQRDPLKVYRSSHAQYGDVIRFRDLTGGSWVFLGHPDAIARIHQVNHRNYGRGSLNKPFAMLLADGLLTSEKEVWSVHRRVLGPCFRRDLQERFAATVQAATREMLDGWVPRADTGRTVDIYPDLGRLTFRTVLRGICDLDLGADEETMLRHLTSALEFVSAESFRLYPMPSWLRWRALRRFRTDLAELDRIAAAGARRTAQARPGSILRALADAGLDAAAMRDELLTFLHAGQHTVASAISFALCLLAAHPDVEERVREELVVLDGQPPGVPELDQLVYLRRVLHEAMRLYPPAWGGVREALADDELQGYRIPAGTAVVFSQYVTHRHPEFWPAPDRFDPDRFTDEQVRIRPRYAYFPFGGGPHLCIGQEPAMVELSIVVAMLLQRYRLRLAPGAKVIPRALLDLVPASGVPMLIGKA